MGLALPPLIGPKSVPSWVSSSGFVGNGFAQKALNFRKGNDLVADGVRGAEFPSLQEPVNGDVGNAENFRRLAHCEREPWKRRNV